MGIAKVKAIVFDWGDTLMKDYTQYKGPMCYWPQVDVIHGVKEALMEIHSKYICCVASNAGDSNAELMGLALDRAGIGEFFSSLYTSEKLGVKKPDVRFYQEIVKRLNLCPDEVVMIGNDYEKDIVPAKMAGMRTILYSENQAPEHTTYADYTINAMKEVYAVVEKIG